VLLQFSWWRFARHRLKCFCTTPRSREINCQNITSFLPATGIAAFIAPPEAFSLGLKPHIDEVIANAKASRRKAHAASCPYSYLFNASKGISKTLQSLRASDRPWAFQEIVICRLRPRERCGQSLIIMHDEAHVYHLKSHGLGSSVPRTFRGPLKLKLARGRVRQGKYFLLTMAEGTIPRCCA